MIRIACGVVALVAAAGCVPRADRAATDFQTYCAGCHGSGGQGNGPMAGGLDPKPADLTGISARNGGAFPLVRVMSQIDGYTRTGDDRSAMPEMGELFQGRSVLVETADGIATPTPARLVALAEYLRGLQN